MTSVLSSPYETHSKVLAHTTRWASNNGSHLGISSPVPTVAARPSNSNKRDTRIIPSEFERWIEKHGGDKEFTDLLNIRVAPRKRRSLLCNVSNAYSSSDESSNSEDEDDERDFTPPASPSIPSSSSSPHISSSSSPSLASSSPYASPPSSPVHSNNTKKPSWLSSLFHKKQSKASSPKSTFNKKIALPSPPASPPLTSPPSPSLSHRTLTHHTNKKVSDFFKKKPSKSSLENNQQKPIPPPLPQRYPIPIERAIYDISWMKLNNPKRPLLHHVSIANLLFWYTSECEGQHALMYIHIPPRTASAKFIN